MLPELVILNQTGEFGLATGAYSVGRSFRYPPFFSAAVDRRQILTTLYGQSLYLVLMKTKFQPKIPSRRLETKVRNKVPRNLAFDM